LRRTLRASRGLERSFNVLFFVVWFCVLFGFVLCVFAVCLVYDDDGPMDYVQVLPQFSFAALNSRWPGTLICNYCSCNVIQCGKRPGESHEGVGRKTSESKWLKVSSSLISSRSSSKTMKLEQATFLPEVSPVQIPNLPVRPK
jgi:hypothetical protein